MPGQDGLWNLLRTKKPKIRYAVVRLVIGWESTFGKLVYVSLIFEVSLSGFGLQAEVPARVGV